MSKSNVAGREADKSTTSVEAGSSEPVCSAWDREVLKARMAGTKAALEDVVVGDNPYHEGVELHWHWMDAWAVTRMEMKQNAKDMPSAGGEPPKTQNTD